MKNITELLTENTITEAKAKKPKTAKVYRITRTHYSMRGDDRKYTMEGTLEELIQAYSYSLECGWSWQNERGNKKINRQPKNIKSLVTNLYNAANNCARNGYSGDSYDYEEIGTIEIPEPNPSSNVEEPKNE